MKIFNIIPLAALLAASPISAQEQELLTDYVDTSIGTGGHGHVFMGASVPFGMVQLGPTSIPTHGTGVQAIMTATLQLSVSPTPISKEPA